MWHEGDGHAGVKALRHECSEGDKLGPYGWVEHDGISYGKQEIIDQRAGVRLVTSMVKPVQLLDPTTSSSSSSRSISGVVNSDGTSRLISTFFNRDFRELFHPRKIMKLLHT